MRFSVSPSQFFRASPAALRITPSLVLFARTQTRAAYTFPVHRHTTYEFLYVTKGIYRCLLNDRTVSAGPDTVVAVKPGDMHEDRCGQGVCFYTVNLMITRSLAGNEPFTGVFTKGIPPASQAVSLPRAVFRPLVTAMYEESKRNDAVSMRIVEDRAAEFFWQFVRYCPDARLSDDMRAAPADDDFKQRLAAIFARDPSHRLSVGRMAEAMNMSESGFAHRCAAAIGVSPAKAFVTYRLERALSMLLETRKPVREVAAETGFNNQFHFSRLFSRVYGKSPRAYRRWIQQR
ncbi:MAG: helix-turn-helix transcriptional regulator [Spirochaetes bacterium]|nr:helix-turn-helix transcriptional regulator [Spirochaetota bacterium]